MAVTESRLMTHLYKELYVESNGGSKRQTYLSSSQLTKINSIKQTHFGGFFVIR
jgi:hypothetical protein